MTGRVGQGGVGGWAGMGRLQRTFIQLEGCMQRRSKERAPIGVEKGR